jgi:hyperosmotically inducible protein
MSAPSGKLETMSRIFTVLQSEKLPMKTRTATLALNTGLVVLMALAASACNKAPDTSGTPAPETTVGTVIDDSVVTANVKSALLSDPAIKSLDFKVETRKGDVQLSGFVDNQAQIDRAIALTKAITGVRSVQNNVTLKIATSSIGNKVDDSIVTTRVKTALLADISIKSFDIAVVTRNGAVQLSGFVNNQSQMDNAVGIAKSTEGVSSVVNELSVKK